MSTTTNVRKYLSRKQRDAIEGQLPVERMRCGPAFVSSASLLPVTTLRLEPLHQAGPVKQKPQQGQHKEGEEEKIYSDEFVAQKLAYFAKVDAEVLRVANDDEDVPENEDDVVMVHCPPPPETPRDLDAALQLPTDASARRPSIATWRYAITRGTPLPFPTTMGQPASHQVRSRKQNRRAPVFEHMDDDHASDEDACEGDDDDESIDNHEEEAAQDVLPSVSLPQIECDDIVISWDGADDVSLGLDSLLAPEEVNEETAVDLASEAKPQDVPEQGDTEPSMEDADDVHAELLSDTRVSMAPESEQSCDDSHAVSHESKHANGDAEDNNTEDEEEEDEATQDEVERTADAVGKSTTTTQQAPPVRRSRRLKRSSMQDIEATVPEDAEAAATSVETEPTLLCEESLESTSAVDSTAEPSRRNTLDCEESLESSNTLEAPSQQKRPLPTRRSRRLQRSRSCSPGATEHDDDFDTDDAVDEGANDMECRQPGEEPTPSPTKDAATEATADAAELVEGQCVDDTVVDTGADMSQSPQQRRRPRRRSRNASEANDEETVDDAVAKEVPEDEVAQAEFGEESANSASDNAEVEEEELDGQHGDELSKAVHHTDAATHASSVSPRTARRLQRQQRATAAAPKPSPTTVVCGGKKRAADPAADETNDVAARPRRSSRRRKQGPPNAADTKDEAAIATESPQPRTTTRAKPPRNAHQDGPQPVRRSSRRAAAAAAAAKLASARGPLRRSCVTDPTRSAISGKGATASKQKRSDAKRSRVNRRQPSHDEEENKEAQSNGGGTMDSRSLKRRKQPTRRSRRVRAATATATEGQEQPAQGKAHQGVIGDNAAGLEMGRESMMEAFAMLAPTYAATPTRSSLLSSAATSAAATPESASTSQLPTPPLSSRLQMGRDSMMRAFEMMQSMAQRGADATSASDDEGGRDTEARLSELPECDAANTSVRMGRDSMMAAMNWMMAGANASPSASAAASPASSTRHSRGRRSSGATDVRMGRDSMAQAMDMWQSMAQRRDTSGGATDDEATTDASMAMGRASMMDAFAMLEQQLQQSGQEGEDEEAEAGPDGHSDGWEEDEDAEEEVDEHNDAGLTMGRDSMMAAFQMMQWNAAQ